MSEQANAQNSDSAAGFDQVDVHIEWPTSAASGGVAATHFAIIDAPSLANGSDDSLFTLVLGNVVAPFFIREEDQVRFIAEGAKLPVQVQGAFLLSNSRLLELANYIRDQLRARGLPE